jgi:hypothetical protein
MNSDASISPREAPLSDKFKSLDDEMKSNDPEQRKREHVALVFHSDVTPPVNEKSKAARMKMSKSLSNQDRWTINPKGNKFFGYFDQAIAVALLYTAIVTPYEIGFLSQGGTKVDALFILGSLVNLVSHAQIAVVHPTCVLV